MDLWFLFYKKGDQVFIKTGIDGVLVQAEIIQHDKTILGNWIVKRDDIFFSMPGKELQRVK